MRLGISAAKSVVARHLAEGKKLTRHPVFPSFEVKTFLIGLLAPMDLLTLTTSRQKHFRMLKYIKVTFFSISPVIQSLVPVLCQVTLYLQE